MVLNESSWIRGFFAYLGFRFFYFEKNLITICVSDSEKNKLDIIDVVFRSTQEVLSWLGKSFDFFNCYLAHLNISKLKRVQSSML